MVGPLDDLLSPRNSSFGLRICTVQLFIYILQENFTEGLWLLKKKQRKSSLLLTLCSGWFSNWLKFFGYLSHSNHKTELKVGRLSSSSIDCALRTTWASAEWTVSFTSCRFLFWKANLCVMAKVSSSAYLLLAGSLTELCASCRKKSCLFCLVTWSSVLGHSCIKSTERPTLLYRLFLNPAVVIMVACRTLCCQPLCCHCENSWWMKCKQFLSQIRLYYVCF